MSEPYNGCISSNTDRSGSNYWQQTDSRWCVVGVSRRVSRGGYRYHQYRSFGRSFVSFLEVAGRFWRLLEARSLAGGITSGVKKI
jgi:hypothetical protein